MQESSRGAYGRPKGTLGHKNRFKDRRIDPYRARRKPSDPTHCSGCGAVFTDGRWTWRSAPLTAVAGICPACRRIADRVPAGIVEIRGAFAQAHRDDVLGLVRNVEAAEKGAHPLERIMNLEAHGDDLMVTTTGVHLARRLGDALARAYQGDVKLQYGDAEQHVRVIWSR